MSRAVPRSVCCDAMRARLSETCEVHPDPADCPDVVVDYSPRVDEYGIPVHDGGSGWIVIEYCPWCGAKLPESRRDEWLAAVRAHGVDPWTDEIPAPYDTDAWWAGT